MILSATNLIPTWFNRNDKKKSWCADRGATDSRQKKISEFQKLLISPILLCFVAAYQKIAVQN
jgi:hypothetical protein